MGIRFGNATLLIVGLFLPTILMAQEDATTRTLLMAALREASLIQRFELEGASGVIVILPEHSREMPDHLVAPGRRWSAETLEEVVAFGRRRGFEARICRYRYCPATDREWSARFSEPAVTNSAARMVMEIQTPLWSSDYLITLRRGEEGWAVTNKQVIAHGFGAPQTGRRP